MYISVLPIFISILLHDRRNTGGGHQARHDDQRRLAPRSFQRAAEKADLSQRVEEGANDADPEEGERSGRAELVRLLFLLIPSVKNTIP